MASPRALLARVAKLEQARVSAVLRLIGSLEQFEAQAQAGIENGAYDRRDMTAVTRCVLRWVDESNSWRN